MVEISKELLDETIVTLNHAKIFISSREKMHPTGRELYEELLNKLRSVSTTTDESK